MAAGAWMTFSPEGAAPNWSMVSQTPVSTHPDAEPAADGAAVGDETLGDGAPALAYASERPIAIEAAAHAYATAAVVVPRSEGETLQHILERVEVKPEPAEPQADTARVAKAAAKPVSSTAFSSRYDEKRRVAELLQRAETALSQLKLTRPVDTSAYTYFLNVLQLDPDNRKARTGVDNIVRKYANMARASLERDDREDATRYITRGLAVDAADPELLRLQRQLGGTTYAQSMPQHGPPRIRRVYVSTATPAPVTPAVSSDSESANDDGLPEIEGESPKQLLRRIKGWFD